MLPLPLLLYFFFLIIAFLTVFKQGLTNYRILIAFLIASGFSIFLGGLSHILAPQIIAKQIGWTTSPPFQFEVGIANILIGVLLIFSYKFKKDWIFAALVANTIWGWGNALGHLLDYKNHNNTSSGNIGWPLYLDILVPIISIFLYRRTF
jgi:hypothetical protein